MDADKDKVWGTLSLTPDHGKSFIFHTPQIAAFTLEKSARKTEYIFEIYRFRGTF